MATTTRVLDANVNGTVYTSNANSALEALDTCHSGATAPTDEVANGKLWLDTSTTPGILKMYNNASWEVIGGSTSSPTFTKVTAGGLTLDGNSLTNNVIIGTNPTLTFSDTGTDDDWRIRNSGGAFIFENGADVSPTTDRMRIDLNGDVSFYDDTAATKFRWDSSEASIGIGKSTPTLAHLDIEGSGDVKPAIHVTSGETYLNTGGNIVPKVPLEGLLNFENNQMMFWPDLSGDGDYDADMWTNSNMYLAAEARIHLRTKIPSKAVDGAAYTGPDVNEGRLVIGADENTNYIQSAKNYSGTVLKDFAIGEYNSSNWWMYFDQSAGGWVGINTTTPASVLDVKGTVTISGSAPKLRIADTDVADEYTDVYNSNGATFIESRNGASNGAMIFRGMGGGTATEFARFNSAGNLGLGITNPSGTLHVNGNTYFGNPPDGLPSNNASGDGAVMNSSGKLSMLGDSDWSLGIGRHTTEGQVAYFYYGGSVVGNIAVTASATAYNTSSDYRLKEDWQPMVGASDRVMALNPVNFAWKSDGSRVDGFLAHEVQSVAPEVVTGEKDAVDADGVPEMQAIDQSKLVPLLTAALQEALTKIDALEARVAALEP